LDIAWLAGFVDGEGSFYLGFQNHGIKDKFPRFITQMAVENTSIEPMLRMSRILKELDVPYTVFMSKYRAEKPHWRPAMRIKVTGHGSMKKLCEALEPHLTCKKEQAKQILYAIEYRNTLGARAHSQNTPELAKDPILTAMSRRVKELNRQRSDMSAYSRIAGEIISAKKPSTTARLAALTRDQVRQMIQSELHGDMQIT
jgi:hypothetical protein